MSDQITAGEADQRTSVPSQAEQFASAHPGLAAALVPEPRLEPDADRADPQLARYVRSYLIMRIFVGAIGIAVPLMLLVGDSWLGGDPVPQSSLSAYYYSGVRELFVGLLTAIAVFLFTYRVAERSWDNLLSLVAGLAVLAVVIFPTARPDHVVEQGAGLTPLQDALTERWVQRIHFGSAAVFILSLAVISLFFGVRELRREQQGKLSPRVWALVHWGCAIAIGLALVYIAVSKWTNVLGRFEPWWWLLLAEWVAVWAFAFSWLTKGLEVDTLIRTGRLSRLLHVILAAVTFGLWLAIWFVARRRIVRPRS